MADDQVPCVFCGAPRPGDSARCPVCRRGWIDSHVVAPGASPAEVPSGAEPPPEPTATEPTTSDGTDIGAAAAAAVAASPAVAPDGGSERPETAAAEAPSPQEATGEAAAAEAPPPGAAPGEATPGAAAPAPTPGVRPPQRPGGDRPPDDRPKDRPSGERPVSPTPPVHPIDDESLHLDPSGTDTRPGKRGGRTGQRLLIAGIVALLIAGWFAALTWITGDDGEDDPVVAATTTTSAAAGSTAQPVATSTTSPAPTTTTTPEPTTTTADPAVLTGPFPESGNPIDVSDLRLGAFAIGPIDFGAADGLGRLVASLGQPQSARVVEDGDFGLCPGEPGFTATWGPLTALFTGTPEEAALAGFRLDSEPPDHPAAGLSTLSELSLGDTVEVLETVYSGFEVSYEEIDGQTSFVLVRSDGVTLLWGPVSSSDPDGTVLGIYSPMPCDGGPEPAS